MKILLLSAPRELHIQLRGLRPPTLRQLQPQHTRHFAIQIAGHAHRYCRNSRRCESRSHAFRVPAQLRMPGPQPADALVPSGVVANVATIVASYRTLSSLRARNRILHSRSQHRRREGQSRIFLVVNMIDAFRNRIIPMPIRPGIGRIIGNPQPETTRDVIPGLNNNLFRLIRKSCSILPALPISVHRVGAGSFDPLRKSTATMKSCPGETVVRSRPFLFAKLSMRSATEKPPLPQDLRAKHH